MLGVTIEAVESIHIGAGSEEFGGIPKPEELERLVKTGGFEAAAQELSKGIWTEHKSFSSVGGKPCIPGSSVKGNVRSRIELSLVSRNGQARSCFIRASPPNMARSPRAWRHRSIWGQVLSEDRWPPCDLTKGDKVCLVCDIFGTAGLRSLVLFGDFVGDGVALEKLDVRPGLRLMVAPKGSRFKGIVTFSNLKPHEIGLLLHGMGLTDGVMGRVVMLGRLKYVGSAGGRPIGKVRYIVNSISISNISEPLFNLSPGTSIEGGELERTVREVLRAAREEYGGGLRVVEEVAKR